MINIFNFVHLGAHSCGVRVPSRYHPCRIWILYHDHCAHCVDCPHDTLDLTLSCLCVYVPLVGDAALFASTFFETFTTNSSDDRTVELIPGGAQRDVTYDSRAQYCDLVLNVRTVAIPTSPAFINCKSQRKMYTLFNSTGCTSSIGKQLPSVRDSPPSCPWPCW